MITFDSGLSGAVKKKEKTVAVYLTGPSRPDLYRVFRQIKSSEKEDKRPGANWPGSFIRLYILKTVIQQKLLLPGIPG
jgi:hypothetical protein